MAWGGSLRLCQPPPISFSTASFLLMLSILFPSRGHVCAFASPTNLGIGWCGPASKQGPA